MPRVVEARLAATSARALHVVGLGVDHAGDARGALRRADPCTSFAICAFGSPARCEADASAPVLNAHERDVRVAVALIASALSAATAASALPRAELRDHLGGDSQSAHDCESASRAAASRRTRVSSVGVTFDLRRRRVPARLPGCGLGGFERLDRMQQQQRREPQGCERTGALRFDECFM